MNKRKIADFFDNCAPWWDDDMIRNEEIIAKILDNCDIGLGDHVLDVACGTGVLFPDYLKRQVASVTGIDISPEMVKIASAKFPQVHVICADVENYAFGRQFDRIMVYNAFPHFPDPNRLVRCLAGLLPPGGKLSVAHGMSRSALLDHHSGSAASVSIDLIHESELQEIFSQWFDVDVVISDDRMYQVCGTRNEIPVESNETNELAEIRAMLKYMIAHNDAHNQELAELAAQMKSAGKLDTYRQIMDAVVDFDVANAKLNDVLFELTR